MNVYSTCPWGFLSIGRRNVSGTWQLLGITKVNKQKALRFSVLQSVGCLPLHPWRTTLSFCFPQLEVSQSAEHWCLFLNHLRRKCVHIYSMLFRFDYSISILVWTIKKFSYHCISQLFVCCFLFCVAHSASFLCAPRHPYVREFGEGLREELVWCIVLLLRQKRVIWKLESIVCAPWREEEKRNYNTYLMWGDFFFIWHISEFIETGFSYAFVFPCQMIWSSVTT